MGTGPAGGASVPSPPASSHLANSFAEGVRTQSGYSSACDRHAQSPRAQLFLREKRHGIPRVEGASVDAPGIGFLAGRVADSKDLPPNQSGPGARLGK